MAATSAFAYALKQRVTVPNTDSVQGVIVGRDDRIKGRAEYSVAWLSAEGLRQVNVYLASELTAAGNKPSNFDQTACYGFVPRAPAAAAAKAPRKSARRKR